jgi:hypothetical protein
VAPPEHDDPSEISDLIRDFARPLLDALGEPRSVDDLSYALTLATLCWNLPIFERAEVAELEEMRVGFDNTLSSVPEPIAVVLRQLLEDRTAKYGSIPYFVLVEIRGQTLADCTVYAEAREAP